MNAFSDPFKEARRESGVMQCPFLGENITMILRHQDVREAARDWQTFSSDAPFRVPIPSEESVRGMRQLPIETDPPLHGHYRQLVEPFFQRAKQPDVMAEVDALVGRMLAGIIDHGPVEIVHDFALPLQSRALTYLLDVPEQEAETWIDWGVHVFRQGSGLKQGFTLDNYLMDRFDQAEADPGPDFFSALTRATFQDRPLTREEMMGFANLAFAGGRDTVILTIACAMAHLAQHPADLEFLRQDPRRITLAGEEFFRVFMPLTQLGRVCPAGAEVHGVPVAPDDRVSLCWASANFDESVFQNPHEIQLDRKPNPHVSFGFGPHLCLGAAHARLLMRSLLGQICKRVKTMSVIAAVERIEQEQTYRRVLGYESLHLSLQSV